MSSYKVEQLLHGYQRGHEQLAGSIRLSARDAELITRLSDLSGSLSGAPKFSSYLTVYPLPSGVYFALAKTWPDPDAARAGCVLTHTILVPMPLWSALSEPRRLQTLFSHPTSRSISEFCSSITMFENNWLDGSSSEENIQPAMLNFVQLYFGEGTRPIVWFGQDGPEDVLWRVLRGLWPRLRASFSACTLCLQPRTLEDRLFELMFAPAAVYPRFLKIPADHFIDANTKPRVDQRKASAEPWCWAWAKRLQGDATAPRLLLGEPDLWMELDDDPTSGRRFFLLNALMEESSSEPQVFVGAMDLVESLAKPKDAAVLSKRIVAKRAVQAARETSEPAKGLECLQLIENRLRRPCFARMQNEFGPTLEDSVAKIVQKHPSIIGQLPTLVHADSELTNSYFERGFLEGCRMVAMESPTQLLGLWNTPVFFKQTLSNEPEIRDAFVRAAAAHRSDLDIRTDLLRWLASIRDHSLRNSIRLSLTSLLGPNDLDLWIELLRDLRVEEVQFMLDALWHQADQFEASGILDLVIDRITRGHPNEVRVWVQKLPQWTVGVAQVFAATYPSTRQGLLDLLAVRAEWDAKKKAEAVAAFLCNLGSGRYPYWVIEVAREQPLLLSALLDPSASSSASVIEQATKLVQEAEALPIAEAPSLLGLILNSSRQSFFKPLLDLTMASLIPAFLAGNVDEPLMRSFHEHSPVIDWLQAVRPKYLISLVVGEARSSRVCWFNAWRWIVIAPNAIYSRRPPVLPEMIDVLLRVQYSAWSTQVANMWSEVLSRTQCLLPDRQTRLFLCAQALKFSFENTRLPLGAVVVESFFEVYTAVMESTKLPPEAESLFGIFDWDKGKELRQRLIDAFYYSDWHASDLFLSVNDERLIRKVFKRLIRRHGGDHYVFRALQELKCRPGFRAARTNDLLRTLFDNPDFYEEWD